MKSNETHMIESPAERFWENIEKEIYIEYQRGEIDPLEDYNVLITIAKTCTLYQDLVKNYPACGYHITLKTYSDLEIDNTRHKYITCAEDICDEKISPIFIDFICICGNFKYGFIKRDEIGNKVKTYILDEISGIYAIITEKFGISLLQKYLNNNEFQDRGLAETIILRDQTLFDKYFPSNNIPLYVCYQVKLILKIMIFCGWDHDDVHPKKFVINDDNIVKVIDFDNVFKLT